MAYVALASSPDELLAEFGLVPGMTISHEAHEAAKSAALKAVEVFREQVTLNCAS